MVAWGFKLTGMSPSSASSLIGSKTWSGFKFDVSPSWNMLMVLSYPLQTMSPELFQSAALILSLLLYDPRQ
ncbi:hypothetical protein OGATHE_006697 [Ogataea polymorpha]|uniref:Uncharacterized protein n=1 Tax=Ogataea polymorpha TaxID=460523 RepID=A0A9P8SYY5_9ASCO|nr:hypothetical protein OGATHE_006697 [Ogataea polymorpha]